MAETVGLVDEICSVSEADLPNELYDNQVYQQNIFFISGFLGARFFAVR